MSAIFLVSVVGKDKLGTLNSLADLTHSYQGKWLSSRVANLEGVFSSIIKVEVPEAQCDALQAAFKAIPDLELTIHPSEGDPQEEVSMLNLVVGAEDRPGLINDITRLLVDHGIYVDKMECNRLMVQAAGENVFNAEFDLRVPADLDTTAVISEIEGLYPHVVVTKS